MRNFIQILFLALLIGCSGCYRDRFPVTPRVAEASTFIVQVDYKGMGLGMVTGTAWSVDEHHLVTAGHVCVASDGKDVVVSDRTRNFRARPILWENSETNGDADLCVLVALGVSLKDPLIISDRMPNVGEKVWTVGYPLGQFAHSNGKYLGDLDGKDSSMNDNSIDAPCDRGASGSSVYIEDGVFGVLVRMRTDGGFVHDGKDGCAVIGLKPLREILDLAGVDYDLTPHVPVE